MSDDQFIEYVADEPVIVEQLDLEGIVKDPEEVKPCQGP